MDPRSETCLVGVHPDLARVIRATPQAPQPFVVTYGVRTVEAELEAMRTGHSKLTDPADSRHVPQPGSGGFACAVDITPLDHGQISFEAGHEAYFYGAIAAMILRTAQQLGIPVEWGGAWHWKDWGHLQLSHARYPK
jgi:hypothetical protein